MNQYVIKHLNSFKLNYIFITLMSMGDDEYIYIFKKTRFL